MAGSMEELLAEGKTLKVTIKGGSIGCSDAQDACDEYGYLLLRQEGDNFLIDTPDGENIVFVDMFGYIDFIVASYEVS